MMLVFWTMTLHGDEHECVDASLRALNSEFERLARIVEDE